MSLAGEAFSVIPQCTNWHQLGQSIKRLLTKRPYTCSSNTSISLPSTCNINITCCKQLAAPRHDFPSKKLLLASPSNPLAANITATNGSAFLLNSSQKIPAVLPLGRKLKPMLMISTAEYHYYSDSQQATQQGPKKSQCDSS